MFKFLALITNKYYWKVHSLIIKLILTLYGIKVGRNFYIEGTPSLKIKGKASNIIIGNNVSITGDIDIRNRENGKLIIDDFVNFENDTRLVVANDATLHIKQGCSIAYHTVINCGCGICIGENTLIGGLVHIQDADHNYTQKNTLIKDQGYSYGKISIGNNVWIAANVTILKNVTIGDNCVVGAKAVVKSGEYEKNSILAKIPAKIVKRLDI
jgi:acetyltransferase-like isoleucine patch superfamily enzyme